MAGGPGQHAQALIDPLDRALPAPPPIPLDGLVSYVPRAGINAGPPTSILLTGTSSTTGSVLDIPGVQGTAMAFESVKSGVATPTFGTLRILPDAVLPRLPSFRDGQVGGFTLAFWARVPTSAADTTHALAGLRSSIVSFDDTDPTVKTICTAPRPQDDLIHIACPPIVYQGISITPNPTIRQIRAYYGSTAAPLNLVNGTCPSFEAVGANGNCGSPSMQALAETACLGKQTCSIHAGRTLTDNSCAQAPFDLSKGTPIVQAVCASNDQSDGPAFVVENAASGHVLSFKVPGFDPMSSGASVKDGAWHHVALTYRPYPGAPYGGLATLYVDGLRAAHSDQINVRPFSEVILGAAPMGALASAYKLSGTTLPATYVSKTGMLAGAADLDEVFIYDRALVDQEVVSLKSKADQHLVRAWPHLPHARIVASGAGLSGGPASVVPVQSTQLYDRGLTKSVATPVLFSDGAVALGLPAGVKFSQSTTDGDLTGLTNYTFAGWVRVGALTAGKNVLRLLQGATPVLQLQVAAGCGGGSLVGKVGTASATPATTCDHVLKAGEWAFVAFTQTGKLQSVTVDGAEIGRTTTAAATSLFTASGGARTFEAGDGVDLYWAGLFDRALKADELVLWRSQGPAAWFDGALFKDTSGSHLRDYAGFHNNNGTLGSAVIPQLWTGAGAASTAAAQAGPLALSPTGALGTITVPANGRFHTVSGSTLVPFSMSARVHLPGGLTSTTPLVAFEVPGTATSTQRPVSAQLVCTFAGTALACHVEVTAKQAASGAVQTWSSAISTVSFASSTGRVKAGFDVDVAIAYDGSSPVVSLGSPGAHKSNGSLDATALPGAIVALTSTTATGTQTVSGKPPVGGSFFRISPGDGSTLSDVRLYARPLSPVELQHLVALDCGSRSCDATGRSCVGATATTMPVCGGCADGIEGASVPGGECFQKLPFFAKCIQSEECESGMCSFEGRCVTTTVTDNCTTTCAALGRTCKQSVYLPAFATCSAKCATDYDPPLGDLAHDACRWNPTRDDGESCSHDTECKSGACISASEVQYAMSLFAPRNCTGITSCPRWTNTTTNQPFACDPNGRYGGSSCPQVATGSSVQAGLKRCAAATSATCEADHKQSRVQHDQGLFKKDAYVCGQCSTASYAGKPLWVPEYRALSPNACATIWNNYVKRSIERRGDWGDIFNEPTLLNLKQFVLDKEGTVTPAEWAALEKAGVGGDTLAFATAPAEDKDPIRARFNGYFLLSDCATPQLTISLPYAQWSYQTDPETGYASQVTQKTFTTPWFDPDFNGITCAANKYPNGTTCPPPGSNTTVAQGYKFCESGFCARDNLVCETGFGRLGVSENASRGDKKQPDGASDMGAFNLIQSNVTAVDAGHDKGPLEKAGAAKEHGYTLTVSNSNKLVMFGSKPFDVLSMEMTMNGNMSEDNADYTSSIFLFDVEIPHGNTPAAKCQAASWTNGKYKKPTKPTCSLVADPKELVPDLPTVKVCFPIPDPCEEGGGIKGGICVRSTTLVGPVPITIEASVIIDACVGAGTEIDDETQEPAFTIKPEIVLNADIKGGVGGSYGPIDVYAGVRAEVTIVGLEFPIKWGLKVERIDKDKDEHAIEDMYTVEFFRGVSAELTVLKLAVGFFAEVGVSIFKVEWEDNMFEYGGLHFAWDLDEHAISSAKLDFQNPTADQ